MRAGLFQSSDDSGLRLVIAAVNPTHDSHIVNPPPMHAETARPIQNETQIGHWIPTVSHFRFAFFFIHFLDVLNRENGPSVSETENAIPNVMRHPASKFQN